jgi:hypothetical protein
LAQFLALEGPRDSPKLSENPAQWKWYLQETSLLPKKLLQLVSSYFFIPFLFVTGPPSGLVSRVVSADTLVDDALTVAKKIASMSQPIGN